MIETPKHCGHFYTATRIKKLDSHQLFKLMSVKKYKILPGLHGPCPQVLDSEGLPEQFPAWHIRLLRSLPPPHVTGQPDHSLQRLHPNKY